MMWTTNSAYTENQGNENALHKLGESCFQSEEGKQAYLQGDHRVEGVAEEQEDVPRGANALPAHGHSTLQFPVSAFFRDNSEPSGTRKFQRSALVGHMQTP